VQSTESTLTTESRSDDGSWIGPSRSGQSSDRIDSMAELHWELSVEHWVPDDQSRRNRVRWFVWNLVGIGNPPSRPVIATAEEVTTVAADSMPDLPDLPNRRLLRVVRTSR
jgi:hypothetical protein